LKAILRNAGVQAFLGWVLAGYLTLILRTVRWRHENLEAVEPTLNATEGGVIALFWHGRIPLCLATAPQWWRRNTRALISPSADGEFIAQALARAGFPAIRGSSAKKGDADKTRGAAAAFRDAMSWLKGGGALVITPDGPRGPGEVIAAGTLQIARRSGAQIFLMGIAVSPFWRLNTWDRITWGLPFGRGAVVWIGPLTAPRDADEAALEVLQRDWSAQLIAATERADAIAAGRA
jgi:lysophospholipid acyltransferase (LPLAT)-like uncharacterized protein